VEEEISNPQMPSPAFQQGASDGLLFVGFLALAFCFLTGNGCWGRGLQKVHRISLQ
jgi:hypothetical protein